MPPPETCSPNYGAFDNMCGSREQCHRGRPEWFLRELECKRKPADHRIAWPCANIIPRPFCQCLPTDPGPGIVKSADVTLAFPSKRFFECVSSVFASACTSCLDSCILMPHSYREMVLLRQVTASVCLGLRGSRVLMHYIHLFAPFLKTGKTVSRASVPDDIDQA